MTPRQKRWLTAAGALALVLSGLGLAQEQTPTRLFNLVFNRDNNTLMAVPGLQAQALPELNLSTILNRVIRQDAGDGSYYFAIDGAGGGGGGSPTGAAGGVLVGTYPNPNALATGVVGTSQLGDGAATAPKLGDGAVTAPKLGDGAVTAPKLGEGAVTEPKLGALAVTEPKLGDGAVTAPKLGEGAVGGPALEATAVNAGTYGSATTSAVIVIDPDGRIQDATSVPIIVETSNTLIDDELPTPCYLHMRIVLTPSIVEYFCAQDAVGEPAENKRCPDNNTCWVPLSSGSTSNATTGIQTTDTEVNSIRFTSLAIAEVDPCNLGAQSLVHVIAGASGKTCALPDPSLPDTVGFFRVYIDDANYLTIAATAGALINGSTVAYPTIKGPNSYYEIWRTSPNQWKITSVGMIGYGLPVTTICSKFGGDTNTSTTGSGAFQNHSLECTIPAGALKTGTELDVCNGWAYTTGTTAPTQMRWRYSIGASYGTAVALNNSGSGMAIGDSVTSKNIVHCVKMTVAGEPSAATPLYTFPLTGWGHINSAQVRGTIVQPVTIATNIPLTIFTESEWNTAGSGGAATMTQETLTVKASGLGD